MLQTLNFNGPRQVNATATFFRYESGSAGGADESIRVRADGQDLGLYWPGDAVELPAQRTIWDIIPTTPAASGVIRLGVGRVQSARLVGTVRVTDSSRDKVLSGNTFVGCIAQGGGVQPTRVQLQNPNGSGKNLWVSAVTVGVSLSEMIGVTVTGTLFGQTNGAIPTALNPTGPGSIALLRYDDANVGLSGISNVRLGYSAAQNDRVVVFPNPVMIPPGRGIFVVGASSNNILRVSFEYEEYPA